MRTTALAMILFAPLLCWSQENGVIQPDLPEMLEKGKIKLFNRQATLLNDEPSRKGIRLEEDRAEAGVAWLEGVEFTKGVIEFDVRGKDLRGRSFVGIAFHGADNETYDGVYLRPFNFQAPAPENRSHAVQYISHPKYPWFTLREEFPGKYEQAIDPAPDPNSWVHVRVVVDSPEISVYINENEKPSLVVEQLSERTSGMIGFWVGNGSGGDFANLEITPL